MSEPSDNRFKGSDLLPDNKSERYIYYSEY